MLPARHLLQPQPHITPLLRSTQGHRRCLRFTGYLLGAIKLGVCADTAPRIFRSS